MMTIQETDRYYDEGYSSAAYTAYVDGQRIGAMTTIEDENSIYLERIDVDDDQQGQGYGTEMIQWVASLRRLVYAAPDNPDSQRLFDRLGEEATGALYGEIGYYDQGYGVYTL